MRNNYDMHVLGDVLADTLRIFGQGMKVVCEIAPMAADAGLVRTDEDVIVIAGTGHGADTAVVLTPVHSQYFFNLRHEDIGYPDFLDGMTAYMENGKVCLVYHEHLHQVGA